MLRVIAESLSLARRIMIRSLALEVEAVIVKDLFIKAMSWLLNVSLRLGTRRINLLIQIFSLH